MQPQRVSTLEPGCPHPSPAPRLPNSVSVNTHPARQSPGLFSVKPGHPQCGLSRLPDVGQPAARTRPEEALSTRQLWASPQRPWFSRVQALEP